MKGRIMVVGDGAKTKFREDRWIGDKPGSKYPILYEICEDKKVTLQQLIGRDWDMQFSRWLPPYL